MNNKPVLERNLERNMDSSIFKSYYYLKEELAAFCRKEGLQTTGSKTELAERIATYLETGQKTRISYKSHKQPSPIIHITKETEIERDFVCSEKHRSFFKQIIGKSFSFNVAFQKWLKSNAGKTYQDAIEAYHQIQEEKKKGKTTIGQQFEYNTYIRDFFADNPDKSLQDAIKCWRYKKELQGDNRYEKADLDILKTSEAVLSPQTYTIRI